MTNRFQVAQKALETIRAGFHADGADLLVRDVVNTRVVVDPVVIDETCLDCIVPHNLLSMIVETAIREALPDIPEVEVLAPPGLRQWVAIGAAG